MLPPTITCEGEQTDGSCERVVVPKCVDRTVRCEELPNPNKLQSSNYRTEEVEMNKLEVPNWQDLRAVDTKLE